MRYLSTEASKLIGKFNTGNTVTIDVYRLSDNSKIVTGGDCTELGTTGFFLYDHGLTPTGFESYLWIMTNGTPSEDVYGELVLNGYPDTIVTNIGLPVALDSGNATIAGMLTKLADDNGGSDFNAGTDSLHEVETKITDAVWDELQTSHTTDGTFGSYIDLAFSDVGAYAGTGTLAITYTLTLSDNGLPIANARVWVSTDSAHAFIVASDTTDTFGVVKFNLDPGTYYFWRYKSGVNFTNPLQGTFSSIVTAATGTGTLADTINTARIKTVTYASSV